jgi:DNA-binding beta-propeller fold protein YncE
MLRLLRGVLLIAIVIVSIQASLIAGPSGYHVVKTYKLGGDGGWDYLTVDSKARRVYISRGTHVMIVDADSGALLGDIPNTNGVHGIALAEDFDKGFISDGRDATVTIFDLKTLKVLGTASTGKNPDAIIYEPVSKRVFTFNGTSHDATAIDAKTGAVAGTIALGGKPEAAVSDEKGHVFVNIEDTGEIVQFDANKLSVENRWKISPGEEPTGLAFDRKHRRLFSVCGNKLMIVVNADNGKIVTTVPIGAGSDGAAFSSDLGFAFSTNGGDGTLTVVRSDAPDKYSVFDTVPTMRRARTIALDAKTDQVYTITAEFGTAPAPTTEQPRPRAPMVPGSFTLLVLSR